MCRTICSTVKRDLCLHDDYCNPAMLPNGQLISRASGTYSIHNQRGSMMAILLLQQTFEIHAVLKSGYLLGRGGYLLKTDLKFWDY